MGEQAKTDMLANVITISQMIVLFSQVDVTTKIFDSMIFKLFLFNLIFRRCYLNVLFDDFDSMLLSSLEYSS